MSKVKFCQYIKTTRAGFGIKLYELTTSNSITLAGFTTYGHVINSSLKFCKEVSFQHLSECTLWCVLQAIKPSKRKSPAGLDDKTAEGMNGFDTLQDFAKKLIQSSNVSSDLERQKIS